MEPRCEIARAFADLRQQVEDRRRVALLAGRLTGGQADLALRHGQPRNGIHHQQHVRALIAKVFGDRQRDEAGADAQRRGPVRSGDDHDGSLAPFFAQFVFEKSRAPRGCVRRSARSR